LKQLKNLADFKSQGSDQIPSIVLKNCAEVLAVPLSQLFQKSLNSGELPMDWLDSLIHPIHKKGSKSDPQNYRPISLTSISCKIMEHIITSQIFNHLQSRSLLNQFQHGFRKNHSCEGQLISVTHDWQSHVLSLIPIDAIFLDFSKAFDSVPHNRLMMKLQSYGITGRVHDWIRIFLTNRRQCTVVGGARSSWKPVRSGVPQGTVLGPLLFLIYINDITDGINSQIRLFADDTMLYRPIRRSHDVSILQTDLNKLNEWSNLWLLKFNPTKCTHLRVSTKQSETIPSQYSINDTIIAQNDSAKYLGVTLTHDFKWKKHWDDTCPRANQMTGLLRRNLSQAPVKAKLLAYTSLVRSKLEYATAATDPYYKGDIYNVEMSQRRAIRFICNDYGMTSSVTAMRLKVGLPELKTRRLDHRLDILRKIYNKDLIVPNAPQLNFGDNILPSANKKIVANTYFRRTLKDLYNLPDSDHRVLPFQHLLQRNLAPPIRITLGGLPSVSVVTERLTFFTP
jgi:hypothetical protein